MFFFNSAAEWRRPLARNISFYKHSVILWPNVSKPLVCTMKYAYENAKVFIVFPTRAKTLVFTMVYQEISGEGVPL